MAVSGSFAGGLAEGFSSSFLPIYKTIKDTKNQEQELALKKQQIKNEQRMSETKLIGEVIKDPSLGTLLLSTFSDKEKEDATGFVKAIIAAAKNNADRTASLMDIIEKNPEALDEARRTHATKDANKLLALVQKWDTIGANKKLGTLVSQASDAQSPYGAIRPTEGGSLEAVQNRQTFGGAANYLKGIHDKGIELSGSALADRFQQIYFKALQDGQVSPDYLQAIKEYIIELRGTESVIVDKDGNVFAFNSKTKALQPLTTPVQSQLKTAEEIKNIQADTANTISDTKIKQNAAPLDNSIRHATIHKIDAEKDKIIAEINAITKNTTTAKDYVETIKTLSEIAGNITNISSLTLPQQREKILTTLQEKYPKQWQIYQNSLSLMNGYLAQLIGDPTVAATEEMSSVDTILNDFIAQGGTIEKWRKTTSAQQQQFYKINKFSPQMVLQWSKKMGE